MTSKPQFPSVEMLVGLHDRMIADVGGSAGIRSIDAIAGAWGRAEARLWYEPDMSVAETAATLGSAIAKAHGFTDGNKRAAFGGLSMTLAMNGLRLTADVDETVGKIVETAAGDGDPTALAAWLRENTETDPVMQGLFDFDLGGPEAS